MNKMLSKSFKQRAIIFGLVASMSAIVASSAFAQDKNEVDDSKGRGERHLKGNRPDMSEAFKNRIDRAQKPANGNQNSFVPRQIEISGANTQRNERPKTPTQEIQLNRQPKQEQQRFADGGNNRRQDYHSNYGDNRQSHLPRQSQENKYFQNRDNRQSDNNQRNQYKEYRRSDNSRNDNYHFNGSRNNHSQDHNSRNYNYNRNFDFNKRNSNSYYGPYGNWRSWNHSWGDPHQYARRWGFDEYHPRYGWRKGPHWYAYPSLWTNWGGWYSFFLNNGNFGFSYNSYFDPYYANYGNQCLRLQTSDWEYGRRAIYSFVACQNRWGQYEEVRGTREFEGWEY